MEGNTQTQAMNDDLAGPANLLHTNWSEATRAEALLLLRRYNDAIEAYNSAQTFAPDDRQWSTTGQQALDIITRQGKPKEAAAIVEKFASIRRDDW